jgi:2-polyprenyl-3-methyl-5-hydroxy-6-metoxy-1,4-benzoquinol methylase
MAHQILNLGCGNKRIEGAINLDVSRDVQADVIHDVNQRPWPFANSSFDEVLGYDVMEHVVDVVSFMEEVHRVAKPNARVRLTVPHFSCANTWRDPTHLHAFAHGSLSLFCDGHELAFYSSARFSKVATHIQFRASVLNKLVSRIANRWPEPYEDRWAWIFPAWFIYYELQVVKPA